MNIEEIKARADMYRHAEECDAVYIEVYLSDVGELFDALEAKERELAAAVEDIHTAYSDGLCEVCGRCESCNMSLERGEEGTVCHGMKFEWRGRKEQNDG